MGSQPQDLHVVFFPFLAYGHMIPTFDIAVLFASRGVKATVITTPKNAPTFVKAIEKREDLKPKIDLKIFEFSAEQLGLPKGCENLDQAMGPGSFDKFFEASELLKDQLENYLEKTKPDCLVADMFFPWATESSAKFNIPRLVFHGTNNFALCIRNIIPKYEPYKNVSSDDEMFAIPSLPHEIKITRVMIAEELRKEEGTQLKTRTERISESEEKSFGVIVNSFYELEPEYSDYFRKVLGRRTWNIGPLSLCNARGRNDLVDEHESMKWLDKKKPDSVVYICFGSTAKFQAPQLHEIAVALEASGKDFLWVVKKGNDENEETEEWLPQGFEERMKGKGLIIRGWAPQVQILEHKAIGAFVTHCGWNSTLEGICAGVPMVTWPIFAEQFYNERFVNVVLKIGVGVGARRWTTAPSIEDLVRRNAIAKAVQEIMVGEQAEEKRKRARELKEMAWKAVQKDGSSYNDLTALLDNIRDYRV